MNAIIKVTKMVLKFSGVVTDVFHLGTMTSSFNACITFYALYV